MFYVIGSEDQSRVLLHTAPANRTKGVMEQFGTSGVPIPCRMKPTYGGTLVFSCTTIIQIHHLTVKFLNVSHYIQNFKEQFSTGSKKRSLYWLGHLGAIYQRVLEKFLHIPPEKHSDSYPAQEIFFQVVAGENRILSTTFLKW